MYAKLITPTSIDRNAPRMAVIDGRYVTGELPADYLATVGFYPLTETPMPEDPQEGYHYEARYDFVYEPYEGVEKPIGIAQSWAEVENPPAPPRTISKYKLKMAIADAGFLPQFEQLLAAVEVKPGYSGAAAFADAVTLDEDNEKFKDAVKAVKSQFGLTDAEVEEILAASVAE